MRERLVKAMAGAAVALTLLSACSGNETGGHPTTGPQSPTSEPATETSSTAANNAAPAVTNPLQATQYLTEPCTVLTATQLQSLNMPTTGEADVDSSTAKISGPFCTWITPGAQGSTVGVGFLTGN